MRINVEHSALDDPRFKRLARALRRPHRLVLGEMLFLWEHCYTARSPYVDSATIDGLMECDGYADAMLADGDDSMALAEEVPAGLAVEDPKGRAVWNPMGRATRLLRVRGVLDRIEYLLEQDGRRELALEAKRKKRDKGLPMGQAKGRHEANPRGRASESGSDSESGISDIYTRARGADPALEVAIDRGERALGLQPAADLGDRRKATRRRVWLAHVSAFNTLRVDLRSDVPALADRLRNEGEELISHYLLGCGADVEGGERDLMHTLAIREAEAERDQSLQWFGPTMWRVEQVERAKAMTLADVRDKGKKAQSGRSAEYVRPTRAL